ncbi:Hsp20/alpha crystallin family protein [Methanoculleus sp.]|uniref:Hsp20/alpha crystallin family protein n=1 Tax=Methanoculleus sp. TaxID=90427 RepID=UPI0025D6FB56|nr:Hsp20/alpha crystallin family protein [Methanoculleus sp.]
MTEKPDDSPGSARRSTNERMNDRETRDAPGGRLPALSREGSRDFRGLTTDFRVDILDHKTEVIVVAELPGAEEDAIRINLLNPQTLRITARRAGPAEEGPTGYYIRERGNGIMSRLIRLPASVTDEAAGTSFKNGVLEVRLQKMRKPPGREGKEIPID